MDGAEVGVFKESGQVGFSGFLNRSEGGSLDAELIVVRLDNLANEPLEGHFGNQKVGGLLVLSDFAERHSTGPPAMDLLDLAIGRNPCLTTSLDSHKGFLAASSGTLSGVCLFCAGHYVLFSMFVSRASLRSAVLCGTEK